MRTEFTRGLRRHQATFGIELSDSSIERLADYYDLILEHNPILHLVGPCSPEEFATRHILESLTMLRYLPNGARFADIGTGGGLPAIPCLIAREDLSAVLIESKEKKASFLDNGSERLGLRDRVSIIARQFSEVPLPDVAFISCRALDKFAERLPKLLKWSGKSRLLLFGGDALGDELAANKIKFDCELMPLSDRRYLFYSR